MKKTFILFVLSTVVTIANAQTTKRSGEKFVLAGGINVGLPIGDFADTHTFGIGAELQTELKRNAFSAIYASVGYTQFFGKKFHFEQPENLSSGLLPVLVGAKFYASPHFFIGAKAGIGVITGWGSGVGFDYQPQLGFNNKSIEVNLSYNGLSAFGTTISGVLVSALYKF